VEKEEFGKAKLAERVRQLGRLKRFLKDNSNSQNWIVSINGSFWWSVWVRQPGEWLGVFYIFQCQELDYETVWQGQAFWQNEFVGSSIYGVVAFRQTICMAEALPNHHASESHCVRLPVYRTFRSLRLADLAIFS